MVLGHTIPDAEDGEPAIHNRQARYLDTQYPTQRMGNPLYTISSRKAGRGYKKEGKVVRSLHRLYTYLQLQSSFQHHSEHLVLRSIATHVHTDSPPTLSLMDSFDSELAALFPITTVSSHVSDGEASSLPVDEEAKGNGGTTYCVMA
ncbi:hypothetical protein LshimejAT787_1800810 [Lyophyllum shimeji]|uniref:Uncharacterized protein n=1 Tax=Lyophyllum shimeji TaxID=47721 RepID=A0A9P3Q0A5_LYOSH|nr:hypothetical protein LshimejAT787_1800810 [Lyophyllum shimeji]